MVISMLEVFLYDLRQNIFVLLITFIESVNDDDCLPQAKGPLDEVLRT